MSLTVELTDEVLRRLEVIAAARGLSVEELAAQTLALLNDGEGGFADVVTETIAEHREILDRLAST